MSALFRERAERIGLGVAFVAALAVLLGQAHSHYPLQEWLFVRYAAYWFGTLVFLFAIAASGLALLRLIWDRPWSLLERIALAFPLGLLAFYFLAFVAGLFGLYGTTFFFGAPLLLSGLGLYGSRRLLVRVAHHSRRVVRSPRFRPSWGQLVLHGFGLAALGLIYFSILSPTNVGYDARWYHLPLAEQYSDAGRIFRFQEGWVMGTYPQLSSLVYTWAFLAPGAQLFDRVEFCAHLEFGLLIARLFALPCLVRALLPAELRPRQRGFSTWALMFSYPGIFLYDSALGIGADHIAALFSVPILLALVRFQESLPPRGAILLAAFISGTLLTKYTGLMVAIPAILVAVGLYAFRLVNPDALRRGILVKSAVAFLVAGLLFTAPHWLKNLIWYGDPLYPQLHTKLALRPWTLAADIPYHFDIAVPWHATRDFKGFLEALRVTATFAFKHHDWAELHGKTPIFGFLFSLTVFALPFLRRSLRLWAAFAFSHAGVFVWAMISWQDRYLQILVPTMAAASTAVLLIGFERKGVARVIAVALVAAQFIWGSDVYFFSTHRMIRSPIEASVKLLNAGREKNYERRYELFEGNVKVDEALPPRAKPLVHESRQTLGIGRQRVADRPGTQGLLYYEETKSALSLFKQLRGIGVTHLVYAEPEGISTVGADLVFYDFVSRTSGRDKRVGSWRVKALVEPSKDKNYAASKVAVFDCGRGYAPGLYPLPSLRVSPFDPKQRFPKPEVALARTGATELVGRADFVVVNSACPTTDFPVRTPGFVQLTSYGKIRLFGRPDSSESRP